MTALAGEALAVQEEVLFQHCAGWRRRCEDLGLELPRFDNVVDEFDFVVEKLREVERRPSLEAWTALHGVPPWQIEGEMIEAEWIAAEQEFDRKAERIVRSLARQEERPLSDQVLDLLVPGRALPAKEISRALGVDRAAVYEALAHLLEQGRVETGPSGRFWRPEREST